METQCQNNKLIIKILPENGCQTYPPQGLTTRLSVDPFFCLYSLGFAGFFKFTF